MNAVLVPAETLIFYIIGYGATPNSWEGLMTIVGVLGWNYRHGSAFTRKTDFFTFGQQHHNACEDPFDRR